MKHFVENIINQAGVPVPNASVTVLNAGTQVSAPLFSDDGITSRTNPVVTDSLGRFDFYIADGRYDLAVTGATILPFTISNVEIVDVTEATASDTSWNTERLQFVNQTLAQAPPPAGSLAAYSKASNKHLFIQDENGVETDLTTAGANILPLNNVFTGTNEFDKNVSFKGPSPYVDITAFGARAGNVNLAPFTSGITANCTSGSNQVTISSASTFVNGDGVVLYGCGAPHSLATPSISSVAPAIALIGTGTGLVSTTVPAGTTTYNYSVVWRNRAGGLTAASPVLSTTTGVQALGKGTVNITSLSAVNDVVTVTTSAAHGFAPGCNFGSCGKVFINSNNGLTDSSFYGWYPVTGASDSTHFTYTRGQLDTRNGASTSATGGSASWWYANRITLSSEANGWEAYVYSDRANPGTFALIGVSKPQGINTDLTWDDFGSPMMDGFTAPAFVPTTLPSVASSNPLVTTIVSGAGTTTLTLATAAGSTLTGTGIRLDAAPGILAAATSASASTGTLFIPPASTGFFVVNSFLDLTALNISISQAGALYLNDTIATRANWYGDRSPQFGSQNQAGAWQGNPIVFVNTANPGVYNSQRFATVLQGISLSSVNAGGNNALLALYEGGFNMAFIGNSFATATGNNDYMGIGLYLRGNLGQSATNVIMDRNLFSSGNPGAGADGSITPLFYCNLCGQGQVRSQYNLHRTNQLHVISGSWNIEHSYINGGFGPLWVVNAVNGNGLSLTMSMITLDTFAHPCVANFGNTFSIQFPFGVCSTASTGPAGFSPSITGFPTSIFGGAALSGINPPLLPNKSTAGLITQNGAIDGIFNITSGAFWQTFAVEGAIAAGTNYPIFVNAARPAAPSAVVSAGGTLPVGTYQFFLVPVWQNGGEGTSSFLSNAVTTTSGNQTVTITFSPVQGNPKAYNLYYCNSNGLNCTGGAVVSNSWGPNLPASASPVVWTVQGFASIVASGQVATAGGPTMLMPGTQGIATPALVLAGNSLTAPASGTLAISSGSPASGNLPRYSTPSGVLVDSGVAANSLATVPLAVGNIAPGSSGQCINTSGTTAVWGSCAGTAGVQTVSAISSGGVANTATTNVQTVTSFSPGFAPGALNATGKTIRATVTGAYSLLNTSQFLTFGLSLQGGATGAIFIPAGPAAGGYTVVWTCMVRTAGVNGLMLCGGVATLGTSGGSTNFSGGVTTNEVGSVNLTTAMSLASTVQFGPTASNSNLLNESWMLVEQLN